ncbi:MAG: asparagine synthase (glutamine-hydrolyzing) [Polyangiaceae bacterium]|nr:asparagine synthase (glutamine-hydrolyzing) [Polyangiaceae bacterium]
MCGIAGFVFRDPNRVTPREALDPVLGNIFHRGPDGEGRIVEAGVAAGMRRLSIIDLSSGDQPIWNEDDTIGVLFNGEIYNFRELREELEKKGHRFRTHSDTEVIVHLYEEEGDRFLSRLSGMFGIFLWDRKKKRALIARDRYGIKPLYLCSSNAGIGFASEIKSLLAMGITRPAIDPTWVADYLRFLWIPEPRTAWQGVRKLAPGCYFTIERGVVQEEKRYFRPSVKEHERSDEEAFAALRETFAKAVERQLVADVDVGVFLSGGFDSTSVAAMAKTKRLPAYTIAIDEQAGDPVDSGAEDVRYAREVANMLGIPLREFQASPDVLAELTRLVPFGDDPIADPAILHTFRICDAARSTSKVLLSGMGADEIAAGYRRHTVARYAEGIYRLPSALRTMASTGGEFVKRAGWGTKHPWQRRVSKLLNALPPDRVDFPFELASYTPHDVIAQLGLVGTSNADLFETISSRVDADKNDLLQSTMAFDVGMYLPSHNLHYVDKMSMAASVEVRVPFLDHEFAEIATSLSNRLRVHNGTGKWALRRAFESFVPESVRTRSKVGFGSPIRHWLRGPLRPVVERMLSSERIRTRGHLSIEGVQQLLARSASEDLAYTVWALMTLEIWSETVLDRHANAAANPHFQ